MVKKKHKPPSRIKYEQNNPTISFRIQRSLYDKLKSVLKEKNMSNADFIKAALQEKQKNIDSNQYKNYTESYELGKKDGLMQGYSKAQDDFAFWCSCYKCKRPFYVKPGTKEYQMVIDQMKEKYCHLECSKD
jgi:flagellar biosynthesis/type III secretory pathway protein FliH